MTTSSETAAIYSDLQAKLMTGAFHPGEKLKLGALQGIYGCSANTIRDVLLRLSNMGLVDFEIQKGFRCRQVSPEMRHDVTRFRILVEQEGALRSMEFGGVAWEAQLSAAHHKLSHIESRMLRTGTPGEDGELWAGAEREFHTTLVSACNSPILIETFANIYVQFRQQMVSLTRDFGEDYFRAIVAEHRAILDAALSRDEAACRQAIYDHLKRNL